VGIGRSVGRPRSDRDADCDLTQDVHGAQRYRRIVVTFLAGAELDPQIFRTKWKEATVIGLVGFFVPFLGCTAIAHYLLHWTGRASWLAGARNTPAKSEKRVPKRITALVGDQIMRSLSAYRVLLDDRSERTLGQVQRRFDAHANSHRAQVERSLGNQELGTGQEDVIRGYPELLENTLGVKTLASCSPPVASASCYERERN
jgi:hypothetical protein